MFNNSFVKPTKWHQKKCYKPCGLDDLNFPEVNEFWKFCEQFIMTNTITQATKIYDEFIEFIAGGTTPESLTQFQYSEQTKERIEDIAECRMQNAELRIKTLAIS